MAYSGKKEITAHQFDLAFGSGEKARTYAFWDQGNLFQLPLTYYRVANSWTNSPGFPQTHPDYGRAIVSRCFECHSSFAGTKIVKTGSLSVLEVVEKGSILYGIDCERCHGPAAEHVAFHEKNPDEKQGMHIPRIQTLTRQQKVDMCAVCHSGNDQKTQKSTFAFTPGDQLTDFYFPQYSRSTKEPDVHGNQYQMLASSACFIKSNMDCSSCHNTHTAEKDNLLLYSQKCATCHSVSEHPKIEKTMAQIRSNCIDCHMPLLPSKVISFQAAGKSTKMPYLLRSHKIAKYPKDAEKIRSYLGNL